MTTVVPHRQRGVCPTLSEPMPTGDGLLARINLTNGAISLSSLTEIAKAAQRFGNGMLEVTSRGNLQIRGLRAETVSSMNAAVEAIDVSIRTGLPIDIAPLAGLCPEERADPRQLADAIKSGSADFAGELGPKVSVVVDGGGASMLGGVKADIRLTALDADTWQVALAGNAETATPLAIHHTTEATACVIELLRKIASAGKQARGRDLLPDEFAPIADTVSHEATHRTVKPGDILPLADKRTAAVIALPFGSANSETLIALCTTLQSLGITELRLAPDRMILLLCPDHRSARDAIDQVATLPVISRPDDPRLRIVACAGAPACASAHLDTHSLAAIIAAKYPKGQNLPGNLHISGCEKQCSKPTGRFISVIGAAGSRKIVANGIVLPQEFSEMLMSKPPLQRAS